MDPWLWLVSFEYYSVVIGQFEDYWIVIGQYLFDLSTTDSSLWTFNRFVDSNEKYSLSMFLTTFCLSAPIPDDIIDQYCIMIGQL